MGEICYWNAPVVLPDGEPFITMMAGRTFGPHYRMERTNTPLFVVGYVTDGRGTLLYNDKTYNLTKGDAFILHASSTHTYYSDDREPFSFLWFNCLGPLITLLLRSYQLENQIVIPQYNDPLLFQQFHAICQAHTDPREIHRRCAVQLHRILISFAEHLRQMEEGGTLAYQTKRYLDEHLNRALTMDELARCTGYSTAHIGRCFKAAYGKTPHQYWMEEKLIAAEKLLSQNGMKVREVAAMFGFADEFHFSNAFYKRFGYRPSRSPHKGNQ